MVYGAARLKGTQSGRRIELVKSKTRAGAMYQSFVLSQQNSHPCVDFTYCERDQHVANLVKAWDCGSWYNKARDRLICKRCKRHQKSRSASATSADEKRA